MPLYEYECDACGQRFEVIQKFSDPAPEACRKCGKGPVHRQASSPAIQFKGTGWYVTDYAQKGKSDSSTTPSGKSSDGGKSDGASSSSSEGGTSKGDGGKTEGKSENKSEGKGDSSKSEGSKSDTAKSDSAKSDSASSSKPSTGGGPKFSKE